MCEIQFIKVLNGKIDKQDFDGFCEMMDEGSYYNGDAWGVHNSKNMVKEPEAFYNFLQRDKLFETVAVGESFLVGHNRLATKGDKKDSKNNHPFESKDYFLVHNGVISNDDTLSQMKELFYKEDTDSAVIISMIQALRNKGFSTVKAIKKTAGMLEGSYSVLLYDKRARKHYYFKNSATNFSFALVIIGGKRVLLGSTNEDNFGLVYRHDDMIFSYEDYDRMMVKTAESGVIYEVGKSDIKEVDKFTPKVRELVKTEERHGSTIYSPDSWGRYEVKPSIFDMAQDVKSLLEEEGISVSIATDYTNKVVRFLPTRKLGSSEVTTGFMVLENLAYWEDEEGFVVVHEDLETIISRNGIY